MNIDLRLGDCLEIMATLPENSIDTIITDPPYGLEFMGKDWDRGVPGVAFWEQALRVAKPGAMLLAMGGTRTFHRLVSAIEDAGWEIRDSIAWLYGSGFPKSYDISKGIDKQAGAEREVVESRKFGGRDGTSVTSGASNGGVQGGYNLKDNRNITAPSTPAAQLWHGWGTALKPAMELICVAMKPIDGTYVNNALTWGVAGLWIDGGRVGHNEACKIMKAQTDDDVMTGNGKYGQAGRRVDTLELKPNGRFPANVIHDGSDEVTGLMSEAARFFYTAKASRSERNAGLEGMEERRKAGAEFRPNHTEKALNGEGGNPYGRWDKIQNHHPTVKPLALMRYLARLTKTPTGGVVLDPFMGSGTTGVACVKEGRSFIGVELNEEYLEIAKKRIENAQAECSQLSIDNLAEE